MRRFVGISLMLALAVVLDERMHGQSSQPPTFKASVDLVSVSVVVNNHDGRPVTGLSRKDFELFDAGRVRDIADFRSESTPVSVAVLLDTSGSMQVSGKWKGARDAVTQLAAELEGGRPRSHRAVRVRFRTPRRPGVHDDTVGGRVRAQQGPAVGIDGAV
jgi:hypothetical protein